MQHMRKVIAIVAGSALLSGCAQINALTKGITLNSLNNDLDATAAKL
ncbi:MAG: hypothetical protein P8X50_07615 [Maritimibacter sp.]